MWYSHTAEGELSMDVLNGANLDLNIDELFNEEPEAGTPPADNKDENKVEMTEVMTKRINEVRAKTEATVRDSVAKDLGFDSYEAMQKAKDEKQIVEAGYDPAELEKLIEPMLEKRLASDPRMQKLAQLEEKEKASYITSELAKITELTGLKVTQADLSQATIDLWGKGIDLSQAYIAANSNKIISATHKGSTTHMLSSTSTKSPQVRGLTAGEKSLYKSINPFATDEELSKKTITIK